MAPSGVSADPFQVPAISTAEALIANTSATSSSQLIGIDSFRCQMRLHLLRGKAGSASTGCACFTRSHPGAEGGGEHFVGVLSEKDEHRGLQRGVRPFQVPHGLIYRDTR